MLKLSKVEIWLCPVSDKYYDKINEERDDELKSSTKGLQATLKAIDCSSLACLLVDENFEAKRLTLRKKGTDGNICLLIVFICVCWADFGLCFELFFIRLK